MANQEGLLEMDKGFHKELALIIRREMVMKCYRGSRKLSLGDMLVLKTLVSCFSMVK